MLEIAKGLKPHATFFPSMAEGLPLQDASVHLALSTISFHHWQGQAAGIHEIARVLRPGGYFLLVDMSFRDWLGRLFRLKRLHRRARLHAPFHPVGLQARM